MVRLSTSDLDVAPLALGGNTFGWTSDVSESFAVLDAFVGAGGSLVDTADVYSAWAPGNRGGESEDIIGRWFERHGHRDDVVIATKVAKHPERRGLSPQNIAACADASLTLLRTDRIDLYYAHEEDPATPIGASVAAFAELQAAGKIRHVGLSNFSGESIRAWIAAADAQGVARPIALQPHYNLVHRVEFEASDRAVASEFDLAVIPYFALAAGFLTGKYARGEEPSGARAGMASEYASDQAFSVVDLVRAIAAAHDVQPASVALAWLAAQETVAAPIASARAIGQLPALLASIDLELAPEEIDALTKASVGL
ncbi:aldo/keto reductase [Actinomyces culturomici]|uniref:aldo/keto reductase n=1 Tax=Actinomyces culturomici TaxID=1926276 RepID=UPI000E204248|nr:aldo/keto reductase [Actinomyces culturomici]